MKESAGQEGEKDAGACCVAAQREAVRRVESRAEGIGLSLFAALVPWIGIKGRDLRLPLKMFS